MTVNMLPMGESNTFHYADKALVVFLPAVGFNQLFLGNSRGPGMIFPVTIRGRSFAYFSLLHREK